MDIEKSIIKQFVGNLYWKDLKGKYLGCNQRFAELIGLSEPSQIIGKTDHDLFLSYLGQQGVQAICDIDQLVMVTGEEKILEEVGLNASHELTCYLTHKVPLRNDKNEIIGLIGTSIDITAYKANDIKDMIINQTPCNLYWKDVDGKYLGCNQNFAKVLNLKSPEEIVGKTDYDFFLEPELVDEIVKIDKKVIQTGKKITIEEIGTGMDRKHATYISKKLPLRTNDGKIVGIIGASLDITREKQAEIARKAFLDNMRHDIRTPFSGLYAITQMLKDNTKEPETKEYLGYVEESAKALLDFMNEVIDVTQLGTFPVKLQSFNIQQTIDEIVKLILPKAKEKNLTVLVDCPNVEIQLDRFRIYRILLNLISNAIKFTDSGSITICVQIEPQLSIAVKDTGIGIPEDKLAIIFEPFTKLVPSYKTGGFTGSGVGLYLSRYMAQEMGGDITAQSVVGKAHALLLPLLMILCKPRR